MGRVTTRVVVRAGAVVAGLLCLVLAARGVMVPMRHHPAATTSPAAAGAGPAASTSSPAPGASPPAAAAEVLPGLGTDTPLPTGTGLQRELGPLLHATALGSAVSLDVLDAATGRDLMAVGAQRPLVPASTAKLLTTTAALSLLGPQATLPTEVVDGATPQEVVLVGGGDVLLGSGHGNPATVPGRAGLADLAARTAAALLAQGRTEVAVRLDDTLFEGPAVSPAWQRSDVSEGYVAPVMALEVAEGMVAGRTARQQDPALAAAKRFATLLAADGIRTVGQVVRMAAPADPTVLAQVRSAPLADLVEYALTESDNTVAEALAREVALHSGRPATFADAGVAVLDTVGLLGVPTDGAKLVGGSGLATGSAVPARTLTRVLALDASDAHPELRAVLTGLPVAGASGTLADRFDSGGQAKALGLVRAKTGTLTGVSSLAGIVVDADGRLLVFAVMADRTGATPAARRALDDVAAALSACGCR